jgi:CheY-like chemotaxis protein
VTKKGALRVFLVEDDPDDVAVVERLASRSPLPVSLTVAASGHDAIEYIAHCRKAGAALPQVILLDIRLPDMNAIEVLRRLSAGPPEEAITTILLSGSDDDRYVRAGQELGAHSHIVKPMMAENFDWIMRSVQRYLGRVAMLPQGQ